MFTFIRSLFSNDLLVELSEKKISIKSFSSSEIYEDEPIIALEQIKNDEIIKAIGQEVRGLNGQKFRILNPFSHPRSFVGNFACAEKILQHGVYVIHNKSFIRAAPRMIIHQLEKTEGGLSDIEERVLHELGAGAGAREVIIYHGNRINPRIETYDQIKCKQTAT